MYKRTVYSHVLYMEDLKTAIARGWDRACVCLGGWVVWGGEGLWPDSESSQTDGSWLTMAVGEQSKGGGRGRARTGWSGVLFGEGGECASSFTPSLRQAVANRHGPLKGLTLKWPPALGLWFRAHVQAERQDSHLPNHPTHSLHPNTSPFILTNSATLPPPTPLSLSSTWLSAGYK